MKHQILLLAITAAAISSCTTAYRTGQTPDDVYYSPARPQDEYVRVEEETDKYRYNDEYYDDRYLRMKVMNRMQWDNLNDWYSYDRYGYRYNYYDGSYWNPYSSWNYYYNPYCRNTFVYINPKVPASQYNYSKPRNFNLNGYTNNNYNFNNTNAGFMKSGTRQTPVSRPVYNNRNNSGFSNTIKEIFSGGNSNNGNNNSYSTPSRSYTPSSSGSSGSSNNSGGSSSGSVTRPVRGGDN